MRPPQSLNETLHHLSSSGFNLPHPACITSPWHTMPLLMPLLFARCSLGERVGKKSTEEAGNSSACSSTTRLGDPKRQRQPPGTLQSVYANQGVGPTGTSAALSHTGSLEPGVSCTPLFLDRCCYEGSK